MSAALVDARRVPFVALVAERTEQAVPRISEKPMIALSGVRSSWLIVAGIATSPDWPEAAASSAVSRCAVVASSSRLVVSSSATWARSRSDSRVAALRKVLIDRGSRKAEGDDQHHDHRDDDGEPIREP